MLSEHTTTFKQAAFYFDVPGIILPELKIIYLILFFCHVLILTWIENPGVFSARLFQEQTKGIPLWFPLLGFGSAQPPKGDKC
jgi:hypothetical protein